MMAPLNRADFVKLSATFAGSLVLAFGIDGCANESAGRAAASSAPEAGGFTPNQWLVLHPDGKATVIINKSEMGQGVATGLPTVLADELDLPFDDVIVAFAPAAPQYVDPVFKAQITGGSTSTAAMWMPLRIAGATAREMLATAAAKQWGVDAATLQTKQGSVIDPASNKTASYGSLVAAASQLAVPKTPKLKSASEFTLIGKQNARYDTLDKVTGRAQYGIDVRVPNMKVATVLHPPVFGATIRSFDASKAKAIHGVTDVVRLPDDMGIAVVATNTWAAFEGRKALAVTYDTGAFRKIGSADLYARFHALAQSKDGAKVALSRGSLEGVHGTVVDATYQGPPAAHATMEPMNATASVTADGVEIWAPTQVQTFAQMSAAKIAGVPPEKVTVHTTYLGGGFGRRLYHDYTDEAVAVSKAIGAPVQVIWPREEDIQHDWYRPMAVSHLRGTLDANGDLVALDHTVVMDSIMAPLLGPPKNGVDDISLDTAVNSPYAIPNVRVNYIDPKSGVPAGSLRAPGANWNAFAVESFIDEAAHAAGKDPVAFRLALLAHDPRAVAVIKTVVQRAGSPAPGTAHGLAFGPWNGTNCATIAEVSMEGTKPRVHRVWVVADCGTVVNPTIVMQQLVGATYYGLSMALYGNITIKDGAVEQHNFYDYAVLRMADAPKVDAYAIPSTEKPSGIGEPATTPIAPAVANAIFALNGSRVRTLPFVPNA